VPANLRCGRPEGDLQAPAEPGWAPLTCTFAGLWEIEPAALQECTAGRHAVQVVDVREPAEFSGPLGHIAGARLLPLAQLARAGANCRPQPAGGHRVPVGRALGAGGGAAAEGRLHRRGQPGRRHAALARRTPADRRRQAALVTTPAGEVWVGVDDRLWRLGPDGDLRHDDTLAALGLPGAPSNLHRHPNGGIVASVRDHATLFVLDPATARVRGRIQPQWPADLARHGARAINLALHPDGRIAIATGGGHTVALFDADGRFIARSAPDLYRFTNGLWWVGDTLWTTDTNRSQLKRLDGRTLALQQTVTLDAAQAARYLGPARLHPTAAERVALIRFHNGMTRGRMAVLDGSSERPLPQATVIEPIDVDWFNDDVVVTDGASHQLLRVDGTSGLARPWADGRARQKLAQGLMQRDRLLLHWKLGLVAAAGLFMVALALAWHAQQLQQQSDDQARPIDLSYLGTPRLTRGQRASDRHALAHARRLPCRRRARAARSRRAPSPGTGRPVRRRSRSTAPPARWPWSCGRPACG
jgi:hypothetical protein